MKSSHKIEEIIESVYPELLNDQSDVDHLLEKYPHDANELRPRLEAIAWLIKNRVEFEPRTGFIASSRTYIEHQLESTQPHGFWQRVTRRYTPQRWVFNLVTPLILILLLILIANNLVLSAQLSIPGDPLYSTKLALEDTRLALTLDQVDKAKYSIQLSRERTTEFVGLVLEGKYELLPSAAAHMETEMITFLHSMNNLTSGEQAANKQLRNEIQESFNNEIYMLEILKDTTPASAHKGIDLAIQVAQSGLMAFHY